MASSLKNLSEFDSKAIPDGSRMRIVIIKAEWNNNITGKLYDACIQFLYDAGVRSKNIISISVPGSFELTAAASKAASILKPDAIICIGCVIKGETPHFDFICNAVANGITQLGIQYKLPFIFGVLTTNTLEQAIERAGGKHGNKGVEAAVTALKMVEAFRNISKKKNK